MINLYKLTIEKPYRDVFHDCSIEYVQKEIKRETEKELKVV